MCVRVRFVLAEEMTIRSRHGVYRQIDGANAQLKQKQFGFKKNLKISLSLSASVVKWSKRHFYESDNIE